MECEETTIKELVTMYDPDDWLTTSQCAELARRHRRTIVNWIIAGWIPAVRDPGSRGQYRVRRSDLETLLMSPASHDRDDISPTVPA